jgi:short-subunit dehydrogenase
MTAKNRPLGTAVVTGASAGVGRATALAFARAGAPVGLIGRDLEALEQVRREIERLGGKAVACPADVADAHAVFAAAERAESRLGPIEVWVNDAMATVFSPVSEISPEEFRRVTEVTYLGFVHGTMAALKHMRQRRHGVIVQVGSALAYRGIPLQAAYCGAKFAIRGFTDALRTELIEEKTGVEIVMVHLPAVNTPQFDWARTHLSHKPRPVPPVVQPEVAARAIVHAARHPKREYWLGRMTIAAILGNMLVPGLADRYLAAGGRASQTTNQTVSPDRRDNLFEPVPGLHRPRGSFGAEASRWAICLPGTETRVAAASVAAAFALAAGVLGFMALRDGGRPPRIR